MIQDIQLIPIGSYLALLIFLFLPITSWSAESNDFGRLFTTAKQRAALDRLRQGYSYNNPSEISQDPIMLRGFVKRGNGKNTVWINDTSTLQNLAGEEGVKVNTRSIYRNRVRLNVMGDTVRLKPGQVYDRSMGKVAEGYIAKQTTENNAKGRGN